MSTNESAVKSLLQGVSQQLPDARHPGQVQEQLNMLSDPVTSVRRRPGLRVRASLSMPGAGTNTLRAWFTDVAGARVHMLLDSGAGVVHVLNEAFTLEASLDSGGYLVNADASRVRAATVGNSMFLVNLDKSPTVHHASAGPSPDSGGFFYVLTGAFSKSFNVTVTHAGASHTASYTTPTGAAVGDAALSTPEYITTQLRTQLAAVPGLAIEQDGPYVFIRGSTTLTVNSSTGVAYLIPSKLNIVTGVGALPSRLPASGDGYVCRVGTADSPQYYKYVHSDTLWLEEGSFGSPSTISNCPVSVEWDGSAWGINATPFSGRHAGDDKSNAAHDWMTYGITGMATYQGRLVLMSGSMVSLSASGKPREFFRTTVTSVLSSDPIEIGSGMLSAAAYEWALPFQKDLVLFSKSYQAVIPSGNSPVTPSTATVVPTSAHETDTSSSPITIGRTVLYSKPRSKDYFGVMEMVPSNNVDSQYVSQDSTPHLPEYMPGRCRFAVSSSVANMALFSASGDPRVLVVHEYHWDADTKVQQAWHKWVFEYPVADAYFASDVIVMVTVRNGVAVLSTIDPRQPAVDVNSVHNPFLDYYTTRSASGTSAVLPSWWESFAPEKRAGLKASVASGALAGMPVGITVQGNAVTVDPTYSDAQIHLGVAYESAFTPSPPTVTDYKDQVIHSGRATLVRYTVGTRNTGECAVTVSDDYSSPTDFVLYPQQWASPGVELGGNPYTGPGTVVVPCRTDMRSTLMRLSTSGLQDMNITHIEYVFKYAPKIRRR